MIKILNDAIYKPIEDTDKVIKGHSAMHDANVLLRRMQERNAKKKENIERELAKYFK